MTILVGFSAYLVGFVCIALGVIWLFRGEARIFYGFRVEGNNARTASIILIVVGVAILIFAFFVLPNLLPEDLFPPG